MTRRRDSRGNVSVLVTAVVVVAVLLCGTLAHLASAAIGKSRAENAADAAALAATGVLALGRPPAEACVVARRSAAENGAQLSTCRCAASAIGFTSAEVTVEMRGAHARARAEVDSPMSLEGGEVYRTHQ